MLKHVDRDFRIIDETDDYIVVDKPAFLLTHPTKPDQRTTLWKELRELLAFEIANGGQVSIVNRLDRETSGLVLVAKTSTAARRFGLLMQEHRLRKEYLAIVLGWPEWETKIVDAPMDRQGKHQPSVIWLKQMIHPAGARALTELRVEKRFGKSGYPVVGDKIYGPNEQLYLEFIETGWTPKLERELLLPRHALQSSKLAIENEHEWTSQLPAELAWFVDNSL